MTIKELLESLLEEGVLITNIKTSFNGLDLPKGWGDLHQPLDPFRNLWGRGVMGSGKMSDGTYETYVGNLAASHAMLKRKLQSETMKTFYFGFADGTLYLDNASIGGSVPYDNLILKSIAVALTEKGSPLMGSKFKLGGA